jgi:hypothetical protein
LAAPEIRYHHRVATVVARTTVSFEVFKQRLDESMRRSFAVHVVGKQWVGQTLTIAAPYCRASGTYNAGQFSGPIEIAGPAIFLRPAIYADMKRMLRDAGCHDSRIL